MRTKDVSQRPRLFAMLRPSIRNAMINRRSAYCSNCNSNVVHVRVFQNRFTYALDKMTFSVLGWFGFGPWQCVDCRFRGMTLIPIQRLVREVSDEPDLVDPQKPIGNFIRTEHSLAHTSADQTRFSSKYRMAIVEKLLDGKSTVSRTCHELGISELEIQRWIRDYHQSELEKVSKVAAGALIQPEPAGSEKPEPIDWSREEMAGMVIESTVVRKPR